MTFFFSIPPQYFGLVAFSFYAVALLTVGLWARHQRKKAHAKDFLLGDRNVNFWVGAISANASDMSAWLFLGLPFVVYQRGLFHLWMVFGLLVFMFLSWKLIAPKLRRQTEELGAPTLSSYLAARLDDKTGYLSLLGACLTLFFLTPYVAAGLIAVGNFFETLLHLPYHMGCLLGVLLVVGYTLLGGLAAVAWVDFVQGIFLLVIIILVPFLTFHKLPTDVTLWQVATQQQVSLSLLPNYQPSTLLGAMNLFLGWGVGYFGQPHILDKFMALRDPHKIQFSKYISSAWQFLALGASTACGLVAIVFFYPNGPHNPQLLFIELVQQLFQPFVATGILCAVLAATLSSMDSQVLVIASSITHDIVPRLYNKRLTPAQTLWLSRLSIVGMSCVALAIAWSKNQVIYNLISFCWMGLGCSFGPVILLCLNSRWLTRQGALAALATGGAIGALWPYTKLPLSAPIPGFLGAFGIAYLFSYLERKSKK